MKLSPRLRSRGGSDDGAIRWRRERSLVPRMIEGEDFDLSAYPNLTLWLDGSDTDTLTIDGTNVTQWRSKEGNAYEFNAPSNRWPQSSTSLTLNGKRFVRFVRGATSETDVLENTVATLGDLFNAGTHTIYAVFRVNAVSLNDAVGENHNLFGDVSGYWGLHARSAAGVPMIQQFIYDAVSPTIAPPDDYEVVERAASLGSVVVLVIRHQVNPTRIFNGNSGGGSIVSCGTTADATFFINQTGLNWATQAVTGLDGSRIVRQRDICRILTNGGDADVVLGDYDILDPVPDQTGPPFFSTIPTRLRLLTNPGAASDVAIDYDIFEHLIGLSPTSAMADGEWAPGAILDTDGLASTGLYIGGSVIQPSLGADVDWMELAVFDADHSAATADEILAGIKAQWGLL